MVYRESLNGAVKPVNVDMNRACDTKPSVSLVGAASWNMYVTPHKELTFIVVMGHDGMGQAIG